LVELHFFLQRWPTQHPDFRPIRRGSRRIRSVVDNVVSQMFLDTKMNRCYWNTTLAEMLTWELVFPLRVRCSHACGLFQRPLKPFFIRCTESDFSPRANIPVSVLGRRGQKPELPTLCRALAALLQVDWFTTSQEILH